MYCSGDLNWLLTCVQLRRRYFFSVEEKFRDKQNFDMLHINVLVPRWRGVFLTYLELSTSNNKWVMALLIFWYLFLIFNWRLRDQDIVFARELWFVVRSVNPAFLVRPMPCCAQQSLSSSVPRVPPILRTLNTHAGYAQSLAGRQAV
jgi:hypothetical protein